MRSRTWELLRNLARDSNLPWVVIGDLNNIAAQHEKKGGVAYPQGLIDGFNKVPEDMDLRYVKLYGRQFTWERGRNTEVWMEIKLDRALASSEWSRLFP